LKESLLLCLLKKNPTEKILGIKEYCDLSELGITELPV
jgi:hypothetical protein